MHLYNLKLITFCDLDARDEDKNPCIAVNFVGHGPRLLLRDKEAAQFLEALKEADRGHLAMGPDEWSGAVPTWIPKPPKKVAPREALGNLMAEIAELEANG